MLVTKLDHNRAEDALEHQFPKIHQFIREQLHLHVLNEEVEVKSVL